MKTYTLPLTIAAFMALAFTVMLFTNQTERADSAGWTPVAQQFASSTIVGPQGTGVVRNQIFAENQACKSRIITTPGTSAIMLSFDDIQSSGTLGSTTVSASLGFLQLASTTKEYDSAIYGCGVWNGWAWASTSLTISEF